MTKDSSYFSGLVASEAGFKSIDVYNGKREELKAIPTDKCFERKQENVGKEDRSQEMNFFFFSC